MSFSARRRQIGAPSHADIADVRPRLPDPGTPLALDERLAFGSVKERRSKRFAVKWEVVRRGQLLATTADLHRRHGRAVFRSLT